MRKWHFLLPGPLSPEREQVLSQQIKKALASWHTHGTPIQFEVQFPYHHFVEITTHQPLSGCAQDHLYRTLIPLLNPLPTDYVAFIEKGKIKTEKFYNIVKLYKAGSWEEARLILEQREEGIVPIRLEESRLAIHLCG